MEDKNWTIIIVVLVVVGLVGASEYEKIRYNQGYQLGYSTGNSYGYTTGYSSGKIDGDKIGYERGYKIGWNTGHLVGYNEGNDTGFKVGWNAGSKAGHDEGYIKGYDFGYNVGYTTTGFNIRDPTYSEAISFISLDRTDDNTYIDESYVCHDFSYDVKRNAFDYGYRCFYVAIEMGNFIIQEGHALVAFNTTDKGIIYIEPQSDRIMNVQVGQHYWDRSIYEVPDYDDTITKIELIP